MESWTLLGTGSEDEELNVLSRSIVSGTLVVQAPEENIWKAICSPLSEGTTSDNSKKKIKHVKSLFSKLFKYTD